MNCDLAGNCLLSLIATASPSVILMFTIAYIFDFFCNILGLSACNEGFKCHVWVYIFAVWHALLKFRFDNCIRRKE